MKKLYVHSISDVTTNSSSEMFICQTEKVSEEVKKILQTFLDAYNIGIGRQEFDETFGEVRQGNKEDVKTLQEWQSGILATQRGVDFKKHPEKQIVIFSAGDNSIPYELFELIETAFNADRLHLG